MVDLLPCRDCGSACQIEVFGPSEQLKQPVSLWICSNHKRFGGDCPSDLAYFSEEAWNDRVDELERVALAVLKGAFNSDPKWLPMARDAARAAIAAMRPEPARSN